MDEIKRVAVACGLPDFRYYTFAPLTVTSIVEVATVSPVDSAACATQLHPVSVAASAAVVTDLVMAHRLVAEPTLAQAAMTPDHKAYDYKMLTDVADLMATPRGLAIKGSPTRRRPRPAARAAMAAIDQT